jgi:hypothetical protein
MSDNFVSNASLKNKYEDRLWPLESQPRVIYIAASLTDQLPAAQFALKLISLGFEVPCRWLHNNFISRPSEGNWPEFPIFQEYWGNLDLEDLERSDTLVILTEHQSTSGGYHVELGYFLGSKRRNILVVGQRPNVFFFTENVRFIQSTEKAAEWLAKPIHGAIEPAPKFSRRSSR